MTQETLPTHTDEIDLRDIIQPLWQAKWRIVLWGTLFALMIGIYQLGGIALDKSDQAQMQVHFNFKGADEGLYPNTTKFSPLELLSGPVLSTVYQRHFGDDDSYQAFTQALTLTPSFVGADALNNVVTSLASKDKGLSVAEFNEAVAAYSETLISKSRTNVTVTLDLAIVNGNLSKATSILTDIADTWATQALTVRGVLNVGKPTIKSQIITASSDELLIKVNILSDTHKLLFDTVKSFSADPHLNAISHPETGLTLVDLSHLLNTEGKYKVAILKEIVIKSGSGSDNSVWYEGFREARLGKLERERSSLERMVTVYEDAMAQFNRQQDWQPKVSSTQTPSSPQIYSPQYSNDLVNSLLQLGSKMADPEYRKHLLEEKIKLSSKLQLVITEIEFYRSANVSIESTLDSDKIGQLIDDSNAKMASINDALTDITKIANERYLTDKGQLYDLQGAVVLVATSNLSGKLKLKLILAFIMGCFVGVVLVFVRRLMSPTEPAS
jgi:capsular polysaccharide biosynthesis protein